MRNSLVVCYTHHTLLLLILGLILSITHMKTMCTPSKAHRMHANILYISYPKRGNDWNIT